MSLLVGNIIWKIFIIFSWVTIRPKPLPKPLQNSLSPRKWPLKNDQPVLDHGRWPSRSEKMRNELFSEKHWLKDFYYFFLSRQSPKCAISWSEGTQNLRAQNARTQKVRKRISAPHCSNPIDQSAPSIIIESQAWLISRDDITGGTPCTILLLP